MNEAARAGASKPRWCEELLVGVGPEGASSTATRLLAEKLASTLGPQWEAVAIAPACGVFALRRSHRIGLKKAWEVCSTLAENVHVRWAEPSVEVPGLEPERRADDEEAPFSALGARVLPSQPLAESEDVRWALESAGVERARSLSPPPGGQRDGAGIVIAHPDTGYTDHPLLADAARLLRSKGYDFVDDDPIAEDPFRSRFGGHGTRTGSVMTASVGSTFAGVAPAASLVPLRVSDSVIHLRYRRLTRAVCFAVERGAHVISMSLGGVTKSRALHDAIRFATRRGVILIAAAGNYWPWCVYPARFPEVVALAAHDARDAPWEHSAAGRTVDLAAPGRDVWCAEPARPNPPPAPSPDDVTRSSGTSYATAITAGAAALWLAFHGRDRLVATYGAAQLGAVFKHQLLASGLRRPRRWDPRYGHGLLDVEALLGAKLPALAPAAGIVATSARAAAVASGGPLEELLEYFDEQERAAVRIELLRQLGEDGSDPVPALIDELAFHIATNPSFREALRPSESSAVAIADLLPQDASTALAQSLQPSPRRSD